MGVLAIEPITLLTTKVRRLEKKVKCGKSRGLRCLSCRCKLAKFARDHKRVTVADAVKLTESNQNTLKWHFGNFAARGYLMR